ncbi:hypothetical protein QTP88_010421 [Uroleucon formosanum]
MDCEEDLNFVFIGDAAFSLEEHVLKPFPQKSLNYERRIYNYRLSRARNVVENAFGLIATICTLHNFLIKHNSSYVKPTSENSETQDTEGIDVSGQFFPLQNCINARNSSAAAKINRDKYLEYFNGVGKVAWQDDMIKKGKS